MSEVVYKDIEVELIDHMGDDLRVSNVARVSFNKWKEEIDDKDAKLIDFLAREEHTSPFRHTAIQLRCKAPISLVRQLGKHQAGFSWNEVSRRYVDDGFEFYKPRMRARAPSKKQGSEAFVVERAVDCDFILQDNTRQCLENYLFLLKNGVAPEVARNVLPQNMMVDWIWTGNLLGVYHLYRLRVGEGSQEEAKEFAEKVGVLVEPIFPLCWKALKEN